ncbi:hypothetical protein ANANG_G00201190 [Anguilla anguilla]|uniref:Interferon-induced transmembrane protein 5 n=1 Tax=Anguilla anguilla TaxID=7936 RepID=A0A9D3RQJ6_ANGAN|nr:hypothetical protein ANANG_G00201190 [Anguilla anguilla]
MSFPSPLGLGRRRPLLSSRGIKQPRGECGAEQTAARARGASHSSERTEERTARQDGQRHVQLPDGLHAAHRLQGGAETGRLHRRQHGPRGGKAPRDYLLWSLCNTLYVNFCCLGFMALIYSVKARDQKTLGNLRGAQECSDKAKWYNILASGWNLLIPLLALVLLVLLLVHLGSAEGTYDFFGEDGYQSFMKLFSR